MLSTSSTRLALAAIAGTAAACGSPADAPIDARSFDAPPDDSACRAPITIPPDPGAEAAATAALQALSPGATLTWAPVRGTFSSITGLVVELPSCTGATNVYDQLFEVLEQTPTLFQIDPAEWRAGNLPCSAVLAGGYHSLHLYRTKYGPYALDNDVFSVVAGVANGTVILHFFSGTYVPRPAPATIAALQACPDRPHTALADQLRAVPFDYEEIAPPPEPQCTFAGSRIYTAAADDSLSFDTTIVARWNETDVLEIHRESAATLRVAPANHTPGLLSSTANCPDPETSKPRVGWIRTFNTMTGEILNDHANPDPYCVVCLQ